MRKVLICLLWFLISGNAVSAMELPSGKSSIFLFGGVFSDGTFPGWTMVPFASNMESNYIVGGALDTDFFSYGGFHFGTEIGVAGRFGKGQPGSIEVWGGPSIYYDRIKLGPVTILPRLVVGLSAVTNTIGIETEREQANSGNATLLFYVGPELAFRVESLPDVEFVLRTQHRSGGKGTLGNMEEGSNANTFGVRFRY